MQDTTNIPKRLTEEEIHVELKTLNSSWKLSEDHKKLERLFEFKGFYKTMGFVNAVAWIAQSHMHHPDMNVSYNKCLIHYTTHDADGLTKNDFECVKAIDALNA